MTRPHFSELFSPEALAEAIGDGFVREQFHPTLPYRILNYTEKAQYERVWTPVTRQCRGLIVDAAGHLVARPYAKFFNYGEDLDLDLPLNARTVVTDKLDGSLGILYPTPDGHAIATRGSFTSEQAEHATKIWQARYAGHTEVGEGITWLFEIIYPGNRIVCDYGDMDDLALLGGVHIASGRPIWPGTFAYNGPKVATFGYVTLADALAAPPRPGAEGFVVRFPDLDHLMVKIKQEDYVRLHRIVTGLNARVVWEALGEGKSVADICEPIPDELHGWVRDLANRLTGAAVVILATAREEHEHILESLPDGWTRKDYAEAAVKSPNRAWLFFLLDGKDPYPKVWQTLRPSGAERPLNHSEDVA